MDYVIGDVQGCFDSLQALLKTINFNDEQDRVFFCGDLVNRGPKSLEVLTWVMDRPDNANTVLGNHDLLLIGCLVGTATQRPTDTLSEVLKSDRKNKITDWLLTRPFLIEEKSFAVVHAGIHPLWSISEAQKKAIVISTKLQGNAMQDFLKTYNAACEWSGIDTVEEHLRTFSLMRVCNFEGKVFLPFNGELDDVPPGLYPWFRHPSRVVTDKLIIFGHWAAIRYQSENNYRAIDTGCAWGRELTAYRINDARRFSTPCIDKIPGKK